MRTSCTVIIPHVDTPIFLRRCLASIKENQSPAVEVSVIVVDQSSLDLFDELRSGDYGVPVTWMHAPKIDAGYPIDLAVKQVTTEYVCTLDCDCWPIHCGWLAVPISLIRTKGLCFVGTDTNLSMAYPTRGYFRHINNFYRVGSTDVHKIISTAVGFMRTCSRDAVSFKPTNNDWGALPCDNGVVANHRAYRMYVDGEVGPSMGLAINRKLGKTTDMGIFGMVVDDLVFHLVFGYGEEYRRMGWDKLGADYNSARTIFESGEISTDDLKRMLLLTGVHANHPGSIDGNDLSVAERLRIEELKEQYK